MPIEPYPKMNARIVDILRINSDNPVTLYAAQRIEKLEAEAERLRSSLEAVLDEATSDLNRDIIITECQSVLKPAPDILPCGHPRSAVRGDGTTHWCTMCEEKAG